MKMLIAIPSYNRPEDIMKRTGKWITKIKTNKDLDWKVFVEPSQLIYYKLFLPKDKLVTTANGIGVTGQMRHVGLYAEQHGYDLIFKIDDDFRMVSKKYKAKDTDKVVAQIIDDVKSTFKEEKRLGAISISHYGTFRWNKDDIMYPIKNRDIYCAYIVRSKLLEFPPKVKLFDDLIVGLHCSELGYYTYVYANAYIDHLEFHNKGGIDFDTRDELSRKDFALIKEEYPHIKEKTDSKKPVFDIDTSYYLKKEKIKL